MGARDPLGNEVTLADAASLPAVCDFAEGFVASQIRVVNVLEAAERDPSPLVQTYAAMLEMFAETGDAPARARSRLDRARASGLAASERERRLMAAVQAWVDADFEEALRLHEEQASRFPRDLVSVKLGQYHCLNLGDSPRMLKLALAALPAADDLPWAHGIAAFGYEQCHLLAHAEREARRAMDLRHDEPWAHHALAHVMLTEGRIGEGRQFMESVSGTWVDLNSFMLTHNWWHLALFVIEQGDLDAALALYDAQVWGVNRGYSQDQIGAVSLLARLELAGADVGDRWAELGQWLARRGTDNVLPFLDMQYLYGLARAGRPEADRLMAAVEAHAPRAPEATRAAWLEVCLPACRGLLAHARGDHEGAIEPLGRALPRLVEIGGSHAQRDLFEQVFIDALLRAGRTVAAQGLVAQRARTQPESRRLARQLADVHAALGLAVPEMPG